MVANSASLVFRTRIYANAAVDYYKFKDGASSNPFQGGGTHKVIGVEYAGADTSFGIGETLPNDVVTVDDDHSLVNNSMVHFSEHMNLTDLIARRADAGFVVDNSTDFIPRIGFTALPQPANKTPAGLGNMFETIAYTTNQTVASMNKIGSSTVYASRKLDLTTNRRVVFIYLEAVGIGPLGNIWTTNYTRPYFGRVQLESENDSIEMNSKKHKCRNPPFSSECQL